MFRLQPALAVGVGMPIPMPTVTLVGGTMLTKVISTGPAFAATNERAAVPMGTTPLENVSVAGDTGVGVGVLTLGMSSPPRLPRSTSRGAPGGPAPMRGPAAGQPRWGGVPGPPARQPR